jgi:DNA-directed RNA polymerase III subunit RPC2
MTYAAPILVDFNYVRGRQVVRRRGIAIGRLPIMLELKCSPTKRRKRWNYYMNVL